MTTRTSPTAQPAANKTLAIADGTKGVVSAKTTGPVSIPNPAPRPPAERPLVAPSTETYGFSFPQLVSDELARARRAHPNRFVDLHQASSVIREEFEEFWDEVKRKVADPEYVLTELKQMAAMIQRTAEDLELVVNRYA